MSKDIKKIFKILEGLGGNSPRRTDQEILDLVDIHTDQEIIDLIGEHRTDQEILDLMRTDQEIRDLITLRSDQEIINLISLRTDQEIIALVGTRRTDQEIIDLIGPHRTDQEISNLANRRTDQEIIDLITFRTDQEIIDLANRRTDQEIIDIANSLKYKPPIGTIVQSLNDEYIPLEAGWFKMDGRSFEAAQLTPGQIVNANNIAIHNNLPNVNNVVLKQSLNIQVQKFGGNNKTTIGQNNLPDYELTGITSEDTHTHEYDEFPDNGNMRKGRGSNIAQKLGNTETKQTSGYNHTHDVTVNLGGGSEALNIENAFFSIVQLIYLGDE